jgi:hypothetical protein
MKQVQVIKKSTSVLRNKKSPRYSNQQVGCRAEYTRGRASYLTFKVRILPEPGTIGLRGRKYGERVQCETRFLYFNIRAEECHNERSDRKGKATLKEIIINNVLKLKKEIQTSKGALCAKQDEFY